jgi:hypothetical protein
MVLKNNLNLIGIILCLFYLNTSAQDINYKKQTQFKLSLKNVETISSDSDNFYIITVDSLYIIDKNGKFKSRKATTKKYLVYENSNSFTLEKNTVKDKTGKTIIELSDKLLKVNMTAKYLAKSKDAFYTCILDSQNMSYSNNIAKLLETKESSMFCYLVGKPAGIYSKGEILWYLYNKSVENQNGMLRIYDIQTGDLISENEIPVINPAGLFVIDDQLYTYSNFSGEFVQLIKGGK